MGRVSNDLFSYAFVSGYVEEIISCNLQSKYVEFKILLDSSNQVVYIVAEVQHIIAVGLKVYAGGKWLDRRNKRFLASSLEISVPSYMTIDTVLGYNDPQLCTDQEVDAKSVHKKLLEQAVVFDVTKLIQRFKLPSNCAKKLYALYKEEATSIILQDPYKLAYDAQIIGFEHAEKIAITLGVYKHQSTARIEAGLQYTLLAESLKKDFSISSLVKNTSILLSINEDKIVAIASKMVKEKKVLIDKN